MGNFRNNRGTSGFGSEGRSRGSKFGGGSRGGFGGGRGGFRGGRDRDSGFSDRPREMHDATCDKCKKQCQVPFRPSGGKPIYCSDCFRSNEGDFRNNDSRPSFAPRGQDRTPSAVAGGISQEQFKQLNTKLDKILSVLEQLEIEVVEGDEDEEFEDEEGDDKEDDSEDEESEE